MCDNNICKMFQVTLQVLAEGNVNITEAKLVAFGVKSIEIFISNDGVTYAPYEVLTLLLCDHIFQLNFH